MVKNSSALNLDAVIRELYQQQLVAPNSLPWIFLNIKYWYIFYLKIRLQMPKNVCFLAIIYQPNTNILYLCFLWSIQI